MRIAVLADTHDRAPTALYEALATADEIWHLGDVTTPAVIEELRTLTKSAGGAGKLRR